MRHIQVRSISKIHAQLQRGHDGEIDQSNPKHHHIFAQLVRKNRRGITSLFHSLSHHLHLAHENAA
jgi:hypothetical protein